MKTGILVTCPVCEKDMNVKVLACKACGAELHGNFAPDPLTRLSESQRQFVITFMQVAGNLKEMERIMGISYPTVRARIAEIVAALGGSPLPKGGPSRREVLELLAQGAIDPDEAARQLAGLS